MVQKIRKNILIVGAANRLVEVMSRRFEREGMNTYLLTDRPVRHSMHIVRSFRMPYDSDSVREVIAACRPETIIFTGAYDTRFLWKQDTEADDYRAFVGGCNHLLSVAEDLSVHLFIFLSSECVYEDHYTRPIHEDWVTFSRSMKSKAVAVSESTVQFFDRHFLMKTAILRLNELYFPPFHPNECQNSCMRMCLDAVTQRQVRINTKLQHGMLYVNDAAEAILRVANAPMIKKSVYHIVGGESVTEDQIAQQIKNASSTAVEIEDQTSGNSCTNVLEDSGFAEEFGFQPHYTVEQGISAVIAFMQRHISWFYKPVHEGTDRESLQLRLFHKLYPFLESLVVFAVVTFLQYALLGNENFARLDFFLLYVVLFSLMHGLMQAIFASTLSMFGFFFIHLHGQDLLTALMDVSVYLWVAQLFIIGMSIGMLRDQLIQLRKDKDDEIAYLNDRLNDISTINTSTTQIKDYFEQQIINNSESMGFFHDIVKTLDEADENETIFTAVQILEKTMRTDSVAIYQISEYYGRLMAASSHLAMKLGKSIKIEAYPEIFNNISRREIFINRSLSDDLPSMVSGITDAEGRLQYAIFAWNLPYDRMTLDGSNMLRILSLMLSNAINRAEKYLSATADAHYYTNTRVLKPQAFRDMFAVFERSFAGTEQEYTILFPENDMSDPEEVNARLIRFLRNSDHVGILESGKCMILLANTNRAEAHKVIERFMASGVVVRLLTPEEAKRLMDEAA